MKLFTTILHDANLSCALPHQRVCTYIKGIIITKGDFDPYSTQKEVPQTRYSIIAEIDRSDK